MLRWLSVITHEWRIEHELEPRIKAEKTSYGFWLKEDTGARECEEFCNKLDELVDLVKDTNEVIFDWDYKDGDLYDKVLYLIKEHLKEEEQ